MKVKSACTTAGIGKGHKYLGHFAKAKYINKGHNNDPLNEEVVPPKDNILKGDQAVADRISSIRRDAQSYEGVKRAKELDDIKLKAEYEKRFNAKLKTDANAAEASQSKYQRIPVWTKP